MTVELANYLIELDKHIVVDGDFKERLDLMIEYPMKFSLDIASTVDDDQNLRVEVWESEKKALKIALHHQDDNTQYGLLRVDYNSRHKNPEETTASVPEIFRKYVGVYLDDYQGHIHYVVDGYKPLAWAIPLEEDGFPVKSINGRDDYSETLLAFLNKINVKTKVTFHTQMRSI